MKIRLSDQQLTLITARAAAAGISVPRLLAEAAAGPPGTPEQAAWHAQLLSARQALTSWIRRVSDLAAQPAASGAGTGATAPELAAIARQIHDTLSQVAFQAIRSRQSAEAGHAHQRPP